MLLLSSIPATTATDILQKHIVVLVDREIALLMFLLILVLGHLIGYCFDQLVLTGTRGEA